MSWVLMLRLAFSCSVFLFVIWVESKRFFDLFCFQKRHRQRRDTMIENISSELFTHVKDSPLESVNFRKIFEAELFRLALKEVS